jgi:hypothetical protein
MKNVSYYEIDFNKLIIDCLYEDSRQPGSPLGGQPLLKIFPGIGNMKGIRVAGRKPHWTLYVLTSTEREPDWPDVLDEASGTLTYWGDNRTPGRELHNAAGNQLFREIFERSTGPRDLRKMVPPGFYFTPGDQGRDVVFRGLLVPKTVQSENTDDLIAVWRSTNGKRFQNYRAKFSVIDASEINLEWISSILKDDEKHELAPSAWKIWLETGKIQVLEAPRTLEYRKKSQQIPENLSEFEMLKFIHSYFEENDSLFEHFATAIWRISDSRVSAWEVTRATRDGGRDAIGKYRIGPDSEPITLDWALEAKRYEPGETSVGVKELSRLISRLRYRQFGILVTTSFVSDQAYKEIREDQHPIVILAGTDIVAILKQAGISSISILSDWLKDNFPLTKSVITIQESIN